MSNSNEPKSFGREVRQESHNDIDGNTHTHVTRTNETVNNVPSSPNAGYVDGRIDENRHQGEVLAERDNENAGRGLLIGILLTSLAALSAGAIWFYNQRNDADVPPTIVIPNSQPDPSPSPAAKQETTIIERTRDVPVPVVVPQQQAPAPQAPAPAPAPDIKIDNSVTQPPATQEVPTTQPTPTQPESQSSTEQGAQSNTETATPTEGMSTTEPTSGSTPSSSGSAGDSAQ